MFQRTLTPLDFGAGAGGSPGSFNPSLWLSAEPAFITTNGARSFNGTNQSLATTAHHPNFQPGSNSFWLSCWFRNTGQNATNRGLLNKWGSGALEEWLLRVITNNAVEFAIKDQTQTTRRVESPANVSQNRWHFAAGFWDVDNKDLWVFLDNVWARENFPTVTEINPAGSLSVKVGLSTSGGEYFAGSICQFGFGILTATRMDEIRRDLAVRIYNNGNPFSLADFTTQESVDFGCVDTCYELNERTGNAPNTNGEFELQDANGVGEDSGPPNGVAVNTNAKNIFFREALSADGDESKTGELQPAGEENKSWNWNGQHQSVATDELVDGSGNGTALIFTSGNMRIRKTTRFVRAGTLSHEQREICNYYSPTPVNGLDINGDVTFACWIKVNQGFVTAGWSGIQYFGNGTPYSNGLNGFCLISTGGGIQEQSFRQPRTVYGDGVTNVAVSLPQWSIIGDGWNHIAATVNKTTNELTIYLNGVPEPPGDISGVGDVTATQTHYSIGYAGVANRTRHWWQEQTVLYNRALSTAEIAAIAAGGAPPSSGLLAHHDADFDLVNERQPSWAWQGNKTGQHRIRFGAPLIPSAAFDVSIDYLRDNDTESGYVMANGGESGGTYGILVWVTTSPPDMQCWVSLPGVGRWTATWQGKAVGLWARLRVVFDGANLAVYQDGVQVATGTLDDQATVGSTQNPLTLGNSSSSDTQGFPGQLRQFSIDGVGEWPLSDGPNLPMVLQPVDGSQDRQWTGDAAQGWAWSGNGNPPPVIDNRSFELTRTLQTTIDQSAVTGENRGMASQKGGSGNTEVGFNLAHHSSNKLSAVLSNGTDQASVFSAETIPGGFVNAAIELTYFDSHLVTDGVRASAGVVNVKTDSQFRIGDYYTRTSFGGWLGHMRALRVYDYELLLDDIHTPQPFPMHEYLLNEGASGNTVTDGTPVNVWLDRSQQKNNAAQSGVTNRPTWRQGPAPFVEFDGADDFLATLAALVDVSAFTFFVVLQPLTITGQHGIVSIGNFNSNGNELFTSPTNHYAGIRGTGGNPASLIYKTSPQTIQALHQYYGANGDRVGQYADETRFITAGAWGTVNDDELYLADRDGTGSLAAHCRIYEVIVYPRRLDDEEVDVVAQNLGRKYGIPF